MINININSVKTYANVQDLLKDLLEYKTVINVQSYEESKEFIKIMRDIYDMGWLDEDIYYTGYDLWFNDTCYDFEKGRSEMEFGGKQCYKNDDKIVIPYSQVRNLLFNGK